MKRDMIFLRSGENLVVKNTKHIYETDTFDILISRFFRFYPTENALSQCEYFVRRKLMVDATKEVFLMWDIDGDNTIDVLHFPIAFRACGMLPKTLALQNKRVCSNRRRVATTSCGTGTQNNLGNGMSLSTF